jgi:UDP-N-acetylmuramate dehydrogenase
MARAAAGGARGAETDGRMSAWLETAESILAEERVPARRDVPLARHTSFGVGGPARLLLEPEDAGSLARALARFTVAGVPFDYLGAGSNLLVADGGPSFVVVSTARLGGEPEFTGGTVRVGAGYSVPKLVKRCAAAGLAGIEFAEGIPASVGGAIKMNAGWHEGMFGNAVAAFEAVSRDGRIDEVRPDATTFAYRRSPGLGDRCVVAATLRLAPDDKDAITARLRDYREHRTRTQPTGVKNAGCVFKNPPGDHAGRLIDACGLKGTRIGAAQVSEVHANFILNHGGATCRDIRELIDRVRVAVLKLTGITLEQEVILWT